MAITEFLHPRLEEICGALPAGLGRRVEDSPALGRWVMALFGGGKRPVATNVGGFLQLYLLSALRLMRLRSLRHQREMERLEAWLKRITVTAASDYGLAVETARCQRLIKGYGSSHARGFSKYERVLAGIDMVHGRQDAADWAARLLKAALQDAEGEALNGALKTVSSFAAGRA